MRYLIYFSFVLFSGNVFSLENNFSDSLSHRLAQTLHDTDRVNTLYALTWQLKYNNPDTGLVLTLEGIELSKKNAWQFGIAKGNQKLGVLHYLKGNFDSALVCYNRSVEFYRDKGKKEELSEALGNLGIVYGYQGNYSKALAAYFEAIKINEANYDSSSTAVNLCNIATVYMMQERLDEALELLNRALDIKTNLGQVEGSHHMLENIGSVYCSKKNYEEALIFFKRALDVVTATKDQFGQASALGNLGIVYGMLEDNEKAIEFFDQSIAIQEEIGDKNGIATNLLNIGSSLGNLTAYDSAEVYLKKGLELSEELGSLEYQKDAYHDLSVLFEKTQRPQEAFVAYKNYIILKDSISNEENIKAQTRLEMGHEHDKAKLIKARDTAEKQRIVDENLHRRNNIQYSVILIALLVVFGGVMSLGFFKVSPRVAEGLIFFSFLIFFEFLLVLADPVIETYSNGAPGYKLLFNAVLAGGIFPLHAFFEKKLKFRLIRKSK